MQQQSKERKTTLHALDAAAKQKINKIKWRRKQLV
jgi:hypothetical protein